MDQEQYLKDRLDDQIEWYENKSSSCQRKYKFWQVMKIVAALLITSLSLWVSAEEEIRSFPLIWNISINMPQVIGIIGAFVVFIESFVKIYDYEKLWIQYRSTAEKLKSEKLLFQTKTKPYHIKASFNVFVKHCEAIMNNEVQGWTELVSEKEEEEQ